MMQITVDISMYPLDADYKLPIKVFIRQLRSCAGLHVISNQMSTQINGEFDAVSTALNHCMREAMEHNGKVVFTVRYLNADLDLNSAPDID